MVEDLIAESSILAEIIGRLMTLKRMQENPALGRRYLGSDDPVIRSGARLICSGHRLPEIDPRLIERLRQEQMEVNEDLADAQFEVKLDGKEQEIILEFMSEF
ncbi:MAG: hypothetical protein RLZZ627_1266 [Pseudomonadota bacterium]|jgi:hypothetical protein